MVLDGEMGYKTLYVSYHVSKDDDDIFLSWHELWSYFFCLNWDFRNDITRFISFLHMFLIYFLGLNKQLIKSEQKILQTETVS